MKKLIIILTYNEAENIYDIIKAIFAIEKDTHILVVDDNSPDGTGKIVDTLIESNTYSNKLHIIHRKSKLGFASAYIDAYKWGINKNYNLFLGIDADFSHDLKAIPYIFDEMKYHDLVIGSRYIKGGCVKDWNLRRKILSYCGNLYERIILWLNIHDLTGGMNCFNRELLKKLDLDSVISKGYCLPAELKFKSHLLKARIKEIPITFRDRMKGKSKIDKKIFFEVLYNIILLSLTRHKIKKHLKEKMNAKKNN